MSDLSPIKGMANCASATANTLAGSLTAQIRDIERIRSWRNHRDLRHWHQQFSEARQVLTIRPPLRKDYYSPPDLPDDDNATWLELIGTQ